MLLALLTLTYPWIARSKPLGFIESTALDSRHKNKREMN